MFEDVLSGARASRPGLKAALDYMRDDDVLVVTRLDRLGRTALDTLRTIERLAQQDVAVIVMKPELDTRTKEGRLMVTIMSGLAEFERVNRPDFRSYREPCPAGAGWADSRSA